jgi:hypothetical protein
MMTQNPANRTAPSRMFLFLWLLLFCLYYPARRAGYVADFTGWLNDIRESSFWDHINRTYFHVKSLYHFTQFVTWALFQLFGTHHILWHITHISLHALNGTLLYTIARRIMEETGVRNCQPIALAGVLLGCITPYLSEVIVWEASFHYLLGNLLLLLIVEQTQRYLQDGSNKRLFAILLLYFLSTFSIELFYITPLILVALLWYYGQALRYPRQAIGKAIGFIILPLLILLLAHFGFVKLAYGRWLPHISADEVVNGTETKALLAKPLKYLFHLLAMGRFWPHETKMMVYRFCEKTKVLYAFYGTAALLLLWIVVRIRAMQALQRSTALFFVWTCIGMALVIPLWFPELLYVVYDRYAYCFSGFFFMWLALVCSYLPGHRLKLFLFLAFAGVNLWFAGKLIRQWQVSAAITDSLMHGLPLQTDKTVLLLNTPECMNGIKMMGGGPTDEAKEMRNLLYAPKVNYPLHDVAAYNMQQASDAVSVMVLNDSTARVTLSQLGGWWWYGGFGANSYETEDYKVVHQEWRYYDLTLKKDPSTYSLLFQAGPEWKQVDWSRKNVEQQ